MPRRRKRARAKEDKPSSAPPDGGPRERDAQGASSGAAAQVSVGEWAERQRRVRRAFPGPRGVDVPLRVAFERDAHAELIAHAKESVEAEVCGVLAGDVCEDDEGPFVHVRAVVRGSATEQGSGHVTFTQETWSGIHTTLEAEHPDAQIVGWYHTHPGFGVAFSDMDLFIQENFFSAPTQIALVLDPLSGEEALCVNTTGGTRPLARFWIGGREQQCRLPRDGSGDDASGAPAAAADPDEALRAVQDRLNQLLQAIDEQHGATYRILLTLGMVVAFAIVVWIGAGIYLSYVSSRRKPPRLRQQVPISVRIGDKTVRLLVGVMEWDVPRELDPARQLQELRQAIEEAAKAAAEKAKKKGKKPGT